MKKIISILLTVLLIAAIGGTAFAAQADSGTGAETGQTMPDFTVPLTDGTTATLSELLKEKKAVILNIFASWCGPCEQEFPEMEKVYQKYSDQIELLAVSGDPADTIEVIRSYKESHGLSFPMGIADGALDFVNFNAYPTTIVIDGSGKVGHVRVGSFPSADEFEKVVTNFISDDYDGTPLPSFAAGGGITLPRVILGAISGLLLVIGRWMLFRKGGKPGWHSLIPVLCSYDEFALCWKGGLGILSVLARCGTAVLAVLMEKNDDLAFVVLAFAIVTVVLSVMESIKLSKAFGKGTFFGIVLVLFSSVGRFILGITGQYQKGSEAAA